MGTNQNSSGALDVVGDIHGHGTRLLALLERLGYRRGPAGWEQPDSRRLVFVGDYIDRGPEPAAAVALVRDLCDAGIAFALMGNHDVNAIQFSLRKDCRGHFDPRQAHRDASAVLDGLAPPAKGWLRSHGGSGGSAKNVHQHKQTLQNCTSDEYDSIVNWACHLPVWLELPGFRAVHAAWIPPAMLALDEWSVRNGLPSLGIKAKTIEEAISLQRDRSRRQGCAPSPALWHDLLDMRDCRAERSRPGSSVAVALERVLKGVEAELPAGVSYRDVQGIERNAVRVRWFEPASGRKFAEHALVRKEVRDAIARDTHDACIGDEYTGIVPMTSAEAYPADERPVFFGHYGLRPTDAFDGWPSNVACVDMTVFDSRQGGLAAYQWNGERSIDAARLVVA